MPKNLYSHLRVKNELLKFGVDLEKIGTYRCLRIGKFISITIKKEYLFVIFDFPMVKKQLQFNIPCTLNLYFQSPFIAFKKLVKFHFEIFKTGIPATNPRNGKKSQIIFKDNLLTYISI